MDGSGLKWLEIAGMAENGWKYLEWLEMAGMAGTGWKWQEMAGNCWNG